ncbi:hypothetical protein L3C95_21380 [Chitinophaga filiformis]|uniref:NUDIX hydrolase n=1 Tax=Chitinophaga filiformis TaxID=104663 RepID=UPI001F3A2450|nr:hypothetical protein [Chitinophaga filiformis]MCF6405470.1 hypothetical protein [Chitinophaga filiformis]
MKVIVLTTCLILACTIAKPQQTPTVINRFKLLITNDSNEFLLVKWKGNWEVPGAGYGDSTVVKPINEFLDDMAAKLGIKIKQRKLAGLFTYYMNDMTYPMIFSYYTAKLDKGQLKLGPGIEDVKWFPISEGLKTVPYPNSSAIIKQVFSSPQTVWGGAFRIYPSQGWRYETISDFYKMN